MNLPLLYSLKNTLKDCNDTPSLIQDEIDHVHQRLLQTIKEELLI
jgi:hypothetical protein